MFCPLPRAGKQISMADPIGGYGIGKRLGHVFLAHEFLENLGPISPRNNHILLLPGGFFLRQLLIGWRI